jgi:hypothetical protein
LTEGCDDEDLPEDLPAPYDSSYSDSDSDSDNFEYPEDAVSHKYKSRETHTSTATNSESLCHDEEANVLSEEALSAGEAMPASADVVLLDCAASSHYFWGTDASLSSSGHIQPANKVHVNGAQRGSELQCFGKMKCKLKTKTGELELDRVLLLPSTLRHRLLSVGQLTRTGYSIIFDGDKCLVIKGGTVVTSTTRTANNLYPLLATNLPSSPLPTNSAAEQALLATDDHSTEQAYLASTYYTGSNFAQQCHAKFNHASVTKGTPLYKKLAAEYGSRFVDCPAFACTDCLVSKVHRLSHPRRTEAERKVRDGGGKLGKISLDSFAWPHAGDHGEKVGTILTDRRLLVPIVTRTRDETPAKIITRLRQMNKLASNATSIEVSQEIFKVTFGDEVDSDSDADTTDLDLEHVHYLKTDGAAEFMGGELTIFCNDNGIEKKASCGHTQQQNPGEPAVKLVTQGIALLHRQLPLRGKWPYAFRFFCHVYGFMPHSGLPGGYDTPHEAVKQKKVPFKDLTKHVHPYGCLCILHIPKALRAHTHGVDKGIFCANLGFSIKKEGFVVLTLKQPRTVIDGVWDVFFIEDRFPIAELHAELLQMGLPDPKLEVSARWKGVDLSWSGITSGDYSGERTSAEADIDEEPTTGDAADYGPAPASTDAATGDDPDRGPAPANTDATTHVATQPQMVDLQLTNWKDMPRLEPALVSNRLPTTVADSTLLQIKSALHTAAAIRRPEPIDVGLPRRSARIRQPSSASLIALANLPPSAPSPTKADADSTGPDDASPLPPIDLNECAMLASVQTEASQAANLSVPKNYKEAIHRTDSTRWTTAMREHIMKLRRIGGGVYKLVKRSEAKNVMRSSWVMASKVRAHHKNGQAKEDSARAVAGGYSQEYGIDFKETYCPTMQFENYKISEAEAINDPSIIREEYDIKGAYYHSMRGLLIQYMEQPPGMGETPESFAAIDLQSDALPPFKPIPGAAKLYVWELQTCFPGTKDAGHHFNSQLTKLVVDDLKLTANPSDSATFYGEFGDMWVRIHSYIDDMTTFGNHQPLIDHCHDTINKRFPLKRSVGISLIIGVTVTKLPDRIEFNQKALIDDVTEFTGQGDAGTERFPYPSGWAGFTEDDCVTDPEARAILDQWPYSNAVGKVAYVVRGTRYECMWLVSVLQRHFHNFGPAMIKALLRLVRYLNSTRSKPLIFRAGYPSDLHPNVTMVDASYASSQLDGTSHEGNVNYHRGCPVAASSKRQRIVALSSMESEFMGAHTAARNCAWRGSYLKYAGLPPPFPLPILEDNTAAIYLSRKHNLNAPRTRHMNVRWHWLQQQVLGNQVILHHLRTSFQVADILTKGVDHGTFTRLSAVLLGHVPVWEYGNGALGRALAPDNALTPQALAASNQHARSAKFSNKQARTPAPHHASYDDEHKQAPPSEQTSTHEQEAAALMYGARYNGDVTGDGAASRPSSASQEASATMFGSRYRSDVTGDGADSHGPFWTDLNAITAIMYPDEPAHTRTASRAQLQLTSNTLGSLEHAAESLITSLTTRHVHVRVHGEPPDANMTAGINELHDIVSLHNAMVFRRRRARSSPPGCHRFASQPIIATCSTRSHAPPVATYHGACPRAQRSRPWA